MCVCVCVPHRLHCKLGPQVIDASNATGNANILNDLRKPGPGTHVLTIDSGNPVVELVVQNNRAGLYGEGLHIEGGGDVGGRLSGWRGAVKAVGWAVTGGSVALGLC